MVEGLKVTGLAGAHMGARLRAVAPTDTDTALRKRSRAQGFDCVEYDLVSHLNQYHAVRQK